MSKIKVMKNKSNKEYGIPFFRPQIEKKDRIQIYNNLSNTILTNGPITEKFEKDFSRYTKIKNSVAVSSATAALHLSLLALGIKKGDEVLVPDITFAATASSVLMTGATPVLVDVNLDDFTIKPESIKDNITKKTKCIIPVHLAGISCNMNYLLKIKKKFQLFMVEDCAHALGTFYNNKHVGSFGEFGCFSFYPTKNITTLEGGMIVSKSTPLANITSRTRNQGINRSLKDRYSKGYPWDYDITEQGFNYRMDEIRATLGCEQLKRISKINEQRRDAFRYYIENLIGQKELILPSVKNLKNNSCHLFIVRINSLNNTLRNNLFKQLSKKGISTSLHYKPLHKFSLFKKHCKIYGKLDNSNLLYEQLLSLPFYTGITKKEQNLVIKEIKEILKN